VHVRVRGAEDRSPLREEQLEAIEPEVGRLDEEEKGQEDQQVRAPPGGDHWPARRQHEHSAQEVDDRGRQQGEQDHPEDPAEAPLPEWKLEDVEGDVALEQGIRHAERPGVPVEQERLPLGAGRQRDEEGEDGGHRLE
jgi:hypothetical protein